MSVYSISLPAVSCASGAKAIITAKSTTRRVRLVEWSVSFNGVTASDVPAEVVLSRFTTDGTTPASTPTPVEWATSGVASDCGGALGVYSAEPTLGDRFGTWLVTPNGGLLMVQYGDLRERPEVEPAVRFGIRVNTTATVSVAGHLVWEEF